MTLLKSPLIELWSRSYIVINLGMTEWWKIRVFFHIVCNEEEKKWEFKIRQAECKFICFLFLIVIFEDIFRGGEVSNALKKMRN